MLDLQALNYSMRKLAIGLGASFKISILNICFIASFRIDSE